MSPSLPDRGRFFVAFLLYLLFVVYGSLVPFQFRDLPLEEALQRFAAIPYLDLGVVSRADWVANLVLYLPLAFLGCASLAGFRENGAWRYGSALLVLLFCVAVAVAVEFTQLYFAPRTVSLNDLLAETLGTLGGIALWLLGWRQLLRLWQAFALGGRQSLLAAVIAYGLLYLALALFPYDFLISLDELTGKLASGRNGWLLAVGCEGWLRCGARLGGEVLAIVPLGVLLGLYQPRLRPPAMLVVGVVLGVALELLQLLLASGTSQGLSALMRGLGLAAGTLGGQALGRHGTRMPARIIGRAAPFAVPPYLLLLTALAGWFSGPWLSPGEALGRLPELRLMPFYYHYFSTEPVAMASLLAHVALYAPVGIGLWAWIGSGSGSRPGVGRGGAGKAALGAALLALVVELGKLLLASRHPDLTNPLVAAGGAAAAYGLARWIERAAAAVHGEPVRVAESGVDRTGATLQDSTPTAVGRGARDAAVHDMNFSAEGMFILGRRVDPLGVAIAAVAAVTAAAGVWVYPLAPLLLALGLLGYGAYLWMRPSLWLLWLPALLPLLDLSPYTGRLLLDEYDLLVLVTLAVGYWRIFPRTPAPWPSRLHAAAVALLWLTWALAMGRGLWPAWEADSLSLTGSHSPLEAWLVGKGLLWALLLVPLLRRVSSRKRQWLQQRLLHGVVAGLVAVTLAVLWERHVYVGLADFESVFRVTGTFSSMNTGGAYIEAFIAFAFPFLAVWVLSQRSWKMRLAGIAAIALVAYAMLVTFSRGGYAGLVAGLGVVALSTLLERSRPLRGRVVVLVLLVAAATAAALPILSGGFAQQRLGRIAEDLAIRVDHWTGALGLMDDGPVAAMLGMGFGRYPALYLARAETGSPPGTFSIQEEDGNPYLRLGAGEALYLDQLVDLELERRYLLSARVRQPGQAALLQVPICEKALLYSFACIWPQLGPQKAGGEWSTLSVWLESGQLGGGGHWPHRPVKLSLYNPVSGEGSGAIDVDDVSLETEYGRQLLENRQFSQGLDHWLFITDRDLAWHIHQQEVEMYFAQGVLGLAALALLLVAAGRNLWPALWSGNPFASALAGALAAFLAVGLLGSTMDTARLSLLFYLGALWAGFLLSPREGDRAGARPTVVLS